MNMIHSHSSRRDFVRLAAVASAGLLFGNTSALAQEGNNRRKEGEVQAEVSPSEDLMREHGVLKRVMLVYEEVLQRWDEKMDVPPEILGNAARIIRTFIEDYHERLEENYLFPRFERAHALVDLVKVLRVQHDAGRRMTDVILRQVKAQAVLKKADNRSKVAEAMRQFNRMYAPHEAREDTVLFPSLRRIISQNEFDSLGEEFEKKEHELFGEDGFESMVDRVADLEKKLGIHDLSKFTPTL